jgi:ABC-type polysaccharide/polyol phosphate transport system ATPase subunit
MEIINFDGVSLWRRTQEEFSYDIKRMVFDLLSGKYRQPAIRQVIADLNLTIYTGEKLGIVGANGAGKSTLLKLISGILTPTVGKVLVRGSIAPLIELGAGFDPNLSVRDNIVMYGVLLGFRRAQMVQRIDSILEFAELQDYELVPVKGLSSGMTARLGFAIATDVQPDILILDEVMSVGDQRFRAKCRQRIERFLTGDTTAIVVSHELDTIRQICDRVVWLDRGSVREIGSPDTVVDNYLTAMGG